MKTKTLLILLISFVLASVTIGQEKKEPVKTEKPKVYKADPNDVGSIDAIIKATYDVISGDAGVKRDWNRFHSLFYRGARLIPAGKNRQTGVIAARPFTPAEYIQRSGNFLVTNGFHEQEIARRTEIYGNIAHVFSTYEGRNKLTDEKPFLRGINSFQLLNDGKRWWVLTIFWQGETPDNLVPTKYLPTKK
jgi:hypothetical protein